MSKDTLSSTVIRMIFNKNFLNVRGDAIEIFPSIVTSARHLGICDEIFLRIYLIFRKCLGNHMFDVVEIDLAALLMDRRSFNKATLSRQFGCFNYPLMFLLNGIIGHDARLIEWANAIVILTFIHGGLTNWGISPLSLYRKFQMVMTIVNLKVDTLTMEAFGIALVSKDKFFTLISPFGLV